MTGYSQGTDGRARSRGLMGGFLSLLLVVTLLAGVWAWYLLFPRLLPAEQPIPFSHRVHAGVKNISCFICHPTAINTPRSGVPELETCMLCHSRIVINFPPVADLRNRYFNDEAVEWIKINELPEYVFFNHQAHLNRSVDCGHCHGDVKKMDRIVQPQVFEMGFCTDCHKTYNVSFDCFTCHR